jgi:hypothetical protein
MTRLDQTHDGLGVKVNIRINEQKVRRLGLLHKPSNGQVASPVDQRFILSRIEHHLNPVHSTGALETKHGLGIGLETHAPITRGGDEEHNSRH